MKKLVFLFLLISNFIFSQDSIKPIFNGFGLLKVNQTTISVIKELEILLKTESKEIKSQGNYSYVQDLINNGTYKKSFILEIVNNKKHKEESPILAPKCELVKLYIVKGYKVSNIELINLHLKFYNDTLTEIKCDITTELKNAIKLKYGDGETQSDRKEIKCTYTYNGNTITYEELEIDETWRNKNTFSTIRFKKYYNSDCKEKYFNYLLISSYKSIEDIINCEKDAINIENQEKLKNLKDF
jgi:hypothetical protein